MVKNELKMNKGKDIRNILFPLFFSGIIIILLVNVCYLQTLKKSYYFFFSLSRFLTYIESFCVHIILKLRKKFFVYQMT